MSGYEINDRVVMRDGEGSTLRGTVTEMSKIDGWPIVTFDDGETLAANPHYLTYERATFEATEFIGRAVMANDKYCAGAHVISVLIRNAHTLNVHLSDGSRLIVTRRERGRMMYRPRPFYQRGDRVQWIGASDWIGTVLSSARVGHEQYITVQFEGTDEPVIVLPDKIRRIS